MGDGLGDAGLVAIGGYVVLLLVIGWLAKRARRDQSLADFYLGGRNLGFCVLFLTLYATQYSGNTMLGFVGKSYRGGFVFLSAVGAMMAVVGAYLIFAPELHRRSKRRGYVTTSDFLFDRFTDRPLAVLGALLGIFALGNYILTNLKVLGILAEEITGGAVSFETGVVALAVVMVVYESMGGMRSVAWTDVIQGLILLVGIGAIFTVVMVGYGGFVGVGEAFDVTRGAGFWSAPDGEAKFGWLSTMLLFFVGISMYPHAVQRIYAARSEAALRRSFQVMVFMPLVTTMLMVLLGVMAIAIAPGLGRAESDRAILHVLGALVEQAPVMQALVVLFVGAILAATMSTIDSALLAISAMFAKDIVRPLRPGVDEAALTRIGKVTSVVLMAVVVYLTILLKDTTIFAILEIKLEVLCQIAPSVMLGVHWPGLRGRPVLAGMVAGTVVAVAVGMGLPGLATRPMGVHAGLWGLLANIVVLLVFQLATGPRARADAEGEG